MYGDDEVTVSVSNTTVDPAGVGRALVGSVGTPYSKTRVPVSLEDVTLLHTNDPLYAASGTLLILNAVSTSSPLIAEVKVTVIVVVEITPSPALILLIPTSPLVGPTIRYSSIFG